MQAQLDGIHPRRAWVTYYGAVGGCLDYLGIEVSDAWLYGGTGWPFVMNMEANVEVASSIAWDGLCVNDCQAHCPGTVVRLEPNLGYTIQAVCSCPYGQHRDTDGARERAWDLVRESIDQGVPCLGFELAYPEFFVIAGYAEEGYLVLIPETGVSAETLSGPTPWREVGPCVQWIRFEAIRPGTPAPDDVVVRRALRAAVERMLRPPDGGPFVMGIGGYDMWAAALDEGRAHGFGHRYTTAAYAELREQAAAFLCEAKERLPGRADGLLDEAIGRYTVVADRLQALHAKHPVEEIEGELIHSPEAAELVRQAGAAERQGFPLLTQIADALG